MKTKKTSKFNELTGKQKAFVVSYLETFNGYKAAKEAGYTGNQETLCAVGYENLRKPHIRDAIGEQLERMGITPERIKCAVSDIAFSADLADFEPWIKGEKSLRELRASGVNTKLLSSISDTVKGRSVKMLDRQRAFDTLAKLLGILSEVHNIKHSGKIDHDITHKDPAKMTTSEMMQLGMVAAQRGLN